MADIKVRENMIERGSRMSAESQLCNNLEKILKLQKSLHQIALKKTEILKADNIEALGELLKDELKHIKAIEVVNNEREQIQHELANEISLSPEHLTISELLSSDGIEEKEKLRSLQEQLIEQMKIIKEINELNQDMLQQSLNFVNLNLDLLLGQESSNYNGQTSDENQSINRSIFDSKA